MAIIQHNKGNVEAAIPLYERFLTKYPHRIEAYSNLSFAYFTRKDYKQSIAVNEKAIANNPEAIDPIINVAKTYMVMNEKDSALFYFRKANTLQPGRKELMQQIELLLPTATK
jgi:tetratricopeptide (TPR) repeat protein